jgi:hypothetical protein
MRIEPAEVGLTGLIDLHIHTAPDVRPRTLDDVSAAVLAEAAGMSAIVLKSHITLTADRATLAQQRVSSLRVCGGLALNEPVGGLNPAAVEVALKIGARIIWMPTLSAQNHRQASGRNDGITILKGDGLEPKLLSILELIAGTDAILATGHLSVPEICLLVPTAKAAGVRRILVNHPEWPGVNMPAEVQEELRDEGAYFERCFVNTTRLGGVVPIERLVADIRRVGIDSTVLATDLGQEGNPLPSDGLRMYAAALLDEGLSEQEVQRMAGENPAALLG